MHPHRHWLRLCATVLAALCLLLFVSCQNRGTDPATTTAAIPNSGGPHGLSFYESLDSLDEYLTLGAYEGLTVTVTEGQTKEDAVWAAVLASSGSVTVPASEVDYYYASLCAQYRYYASLEDITYEELLSSLGLSDAAFRSQAFEMAQKDVLVAAVLRHSGITLTENEKNTLFSKYVEKFADDYGYSQEYIRSSMQELIYETMLYDKVTEYLLANNEINP